MRKLILLTLLITLSGPIFPQVSFAEQKIPVEVAATGEDHVGKQLVFKIKEEIRRSASFKITDNLKESRMKICVTTLDPYKNNPVPGYSGQSTVYSFVIVAAGVFFNDIFITGYVGVCGLKHIKDVAENTIAIIDDNLQFFETAKTNWNSFGEFLKGAFATKDYELKTETQKLMNEIGELELKAMDLQDTLNKEKAKKWWIKLWESFK